MENQILKIIREKKAITFDELRNSSNEKVNPRALNEELKKLINDDKIYYKFKTQTYHLKEETKIGTFAETRHSYSFIEVEVEGGEPVSYFCPGKFVLDALNGDTVKFKLIQSTDKHGNPSEIAKVLRIVKRNGNSILGQVYFDVKENFFSLKLMNAFQKYTYQIINPEFVKDENFVLAKFIDFKNNIILLKVEEIISQKFEANIDHIYVLKKYQKNLEFPDSFASISKNNFDKDELSSLRVDLTKELIYTIDGKSSKDLDDAISAEIIGNDYLLKVHIADVSHYVKEGSELDIIARERANSIYLIDYVRPMLPKILSNDLCSLNPNTEKLSLTVEMIINKKGEILSSKYYASKIISKHRLIYSDVDNFFNGDENVFTDENLKKSLNLIHEIADCLRENKIALGMIDFELPEIKIDIDENKNPIKIYNKFQTISEKVIEDLMVAANESIAKILSNKKLSAAFRIHKKPDLEKLNDLKMFTKTIFKPELFSSETEYEKIKKFTLKATDNISSKDLSDYIATVSELENNTFYKVNLIQTMEKAKYEINNVGHYALGLKYYTHFTSPIRRYPDLVVHRVLSRLLLDSNLTQSESEISELKIISEHCSEIEKESVQIERLLMDVKKARFLQNIIDEKKNLNPDVTVEFEGKIVNILSFGFFVDVKNKFQGLVRYARLIDDEYEPDQQKLFVIGKNNHKKYNIFENIKIVIEDINISQGTIDMNLVPNEINSK